MTTARTAEGAAAAADAAPVAHRPAAAGGAAPASAAPAAAAEHATRAERVIYVSGYGRSGSTLLDILVGNAPGVESVGELDLLHRDWNERTCACGQGYAACPVWSAVGERVTHATGQEDPAAAERTLRRVENLPALPALRLGWIPRAWRHAYTVQVRATLDAVAAATGHSVILDSSKSAREAAGRPYAMEKLAGIPVWRLHLVRDGRAVLWSVKKRGDNVRLGAGSEGGGAAFRFATLRALFGWSLANGLAWLDGRTAPDRTLRVRYEDLVEDPDRELARIGDFLGLDLAEVRRRVRDGEPFPVGHNTGGNRLRQAGAVKVRPDREWEQKLGRGDRLAFWLLAGPVAWVLGYRPGQKAQKGPNKPSIPARNRR